ncbi:hypothetical protein [Burkholderia ubonensis]|uniref:hypothetical protein n=1 Tax=Burkholderia ubonensis TaxID=101571 RepID=UPI0012F90F1A|nr:hypothetical protein [Burkholderia ubonensis]
MVSIMLRFHPPVYRFAADPVRLRRGLRGAPLLVMIGLRAPQHARVRTRTPARSPAARPHHLSVKEN